MKKLCLALLVAVIPTTAFADESKIVIGPVRFADPNLIAENVKTQCDVPVYQAEAMRRQIVRLGFTPVAGPDEIPATGKYLLVRVEQAISAGNPFTGHRKTVTTSAILFENGKEVSKITRTRDSGGGFGAGFKSSCNVLKRCTDTLAKDIAKWLRNHIGTRGGATPAPEEPDTSDTPETVTLSI